MPCSKCDQTIPTPDEANHARFHKREEADAKAPKSKKKQKLKRPPIDSNAKDNRFLNAS